MVTPSYFPIVGGTETYVQHLTHRLNSAGIRADIMTYNMNSKWKPVSIDETKKENGFKIFRIAASNPRLFNFHGHSPYREFLNIHVIPRLTFSREFSNYDIVHFHDDNDISFPAFSNLACKREKPTLLHCHSLPYTYNKYKNNFLCNFLLKTSVDRYVSPSQYTTRLLLNLGLLRERIATLPNAVDTEAFKPDLKKRTDNLILYAARIDRAKGLDVLLKALLLLDTPAHVTIVGPVNDPQFFSEIQSLSQKIRDKTMHKITYLGFVDNNTLIQWHQKAAIFVCSSILDHFPISNLEALACGTSVISTNVGAVPEVIKDGFNGLLVPPGEPLALASALKKFLESKRLRDSCGYNGRRTVEKYFSWDVVWKKMAQLYEQMLAAK
jgi:glycosyltransferase involved in cell wall biosynthesis